PGALHQNSVGGARGPAGGGIGRNARQSRTDGRGGRSRRGRHQFGGRREARRPPRPRPDRGLPLGCHPGGIGVTPAEGDTDSERDRSHTSLDVQDGFAVLTLNRPEVRNALTDPEMLWEIVDVFDHPPAPVLVVTGAGSAFSAGGNVKEMAAGAGMFAGTVGEVAENYRSTIQRLTRAVAHTEAVTIAAVNGPAVGAGFDLVLGCDLRLGS